MIRLVLVLAPIMCIASGLACSYFLSLFVKELDILAIFSRSRRRLFLERKKEYERKQRAVRNPQKDIENTQFHTNRREIAVAAVLTFVYLFHGFTEHSVWVSNETYSNPSIALPLQRNRDGSFSTLDDFREAYSWINSNTDENSKIAAWWDYGYQITSMANRTTIVDNNTWNYTHIGLVAKAFVSPEKVSAKILRDLDVDYVLIWFGGFAGFPADDMNKFQWMSKIAREIDSKLPEVQMSMLDITATAPKSITSSLLYKMSYYRLASMNKVYMNIPNAFDRARNQMALSNIKFSDFEEAYTTENMLVRIYKLKSQPNRR